MANHGDAEGTEDAEALRGDENVLSERIIGAAVEVHRHLGPGLLESAYLECLCRELALRGLEFERQVVLDLHYKGTIIRSAFRADLLVEGRILVELKAVDNLDDVHRAQLLTYLRLRNLHLGLLINFNTPMLWRGVRRVVNGF